MSYEKFRSLILSLLIPPYVFVPTHEYTSVAHEALIYATSFWVYFVRASSLLISSSPLLSSPHLSGCPESTCFFCVINKHIPQPTGFWIKINKTRKTWLAPFPISLRHLEMDGRNLVGSPCVWGVCLPECKCICLGWISPLFSTAVKQLGDNVAPDFETHSSEPVYSKTDCHRDPFFFSQALIHSYLMNTHTQRHCHVWCFCVCA